MEPPLPAGIRRERSYGCEEDDPNGFLQVVRPAVFPPGRSLSSPFPPAAAGGSDGDGHLLLLPSARFMAKEHMFDKVVTPSDVGKLNRLVIPKQHAEKYFPLDAAAGEKGLLLSFEDRTGKGWRFRYSYWNSSQSYVMTKGWSRFVKEKHLDSGDTVSFGRGVDEDGRRRLFIDWKHRPEALPGHPLLLHRFPLPLIHDLPPPFPRSSSWHTAAAAAANSLPSVTAYCHLWHGRSSALAGYGSGSGSYLSQLRSGGDQSRAAVQYGFDGGSGSRGIPAPMPAAFNSLPPAAGRSGGDDRGKTVRLFGVNLGYSPTAPWAGGTSNGGAGSSRGGAGPAALPLLPVRFGGSEAVEAQGVVQPPASSLDLAL